MTLNLVNYQSKTRAAVKHFWKTRSKAISSQKKRGKADQGQRSAVTSGKNMDEFVTLIKDLVVKNGLKDTNLLIKKGQLVLPGFYRPTKTWDLLVIHNNMLVAALEFKSQVGPSFGNNFNNRCEEALGNAIDILTAFREGALGDSPKPFIGYLMLLEDCLESRKNVMVKSPHFPHFPEFENTSYAMRYDLLCKKLMKENLYNSAVVLLSSQEEGKTGQYSEMNKSTGMKRYVSSFAAHIAAASKW